MASDSKPLGDVTGAAGKPSGSDVGAEFNLAPRPPRFCARQQCKTRMAQLIHDPHLLCVQCRGRKCDLGVRCEVCELWDDNTMAEYLAHQHKLEVKRKPKKPSALQGTGSGDLGLSPEKMQEAIEANLRVFLLQQQKEMTRNVISEIKSCLKQGKSSDDVEDQDDPQPNVPGSPNFDPNVPGPSGPPPASPGPLAAYLSDSRYTRAKSLYDEGCISKSALDEVIARCQADDDNAVPEDPVGPPPPKKPKSQYDPDEDPEFDVEPDFGDLLSCMTSIFPDAKDSEIVDKASEFLIGAAKATNKREFVRLKYYEAMSKCQDEVNEKVSKVSLGLGKVLSVWPRKRRYYRVNQFPESVKVNPRVTELAYVKNISNNMSFSFSSSEALALDKALAELV